MKEIPLTKGFVALVDDDDYELVSRHSWQVRIVRNKYRVTMYAQARDPNRKGTMGMHRLIANPRPDQQVDHRNMNGLDNRRENLRCCSKAQNLANRPGFAAAGLKGVRRCETGKGVRFSGFIEGRHLGTFDTAEEAGRAYDHAAIEKWGEFARPNFPNDLEKAKQTA